MSAFKWSSVLAIVILLCLPCQADDYNLLNHVTLKQYPSGSFRVKYGGIRGFVRDQMVSYFHAFHADWLQIKYFDDELSASKELFEMRARQADIDNGGAWFERRWWESLSPELGGAPKYPVRIYRGPTGNLIDIGIAYVTNDFRFKWREYEVSLTKALTPTEPALLLPTSSRNPHDWRLRFKPQATFSTKEIIRNVRMNVFFEYSHRRRRLVSIGIYGMWFPVQSLNSYAVGISVSFLQW